MDVNTVRVSAQTPGSVINLTFDEGSTVQRGQPLVTVDTDKLRFQTEQSDAKIQEIGSQYKNAQAQYKAAIIGRDNLRIRYERFMSLLKSNATTQQSVDDLKAQLDVANEQLRATEESLNALQSKKKQLESARRVVEKTMADASILAPVSGTVLVRYTDIGELLGTGSPVCDIADLSELWTKIYIEEQMLPSIKLGQIVSVKVDGVSNKTFEGKISWISDKAEFTPKTILTEETRTALVFPAKVLVKNPDGMLKIGMPVSIVVKKGS